MNLSKVGKLVVANAAAAVVCSSSATVAAEVRTVTNTDELVAALNEAVAGDQVVIESGDYEVSGIIEATLEGTADMPIEIMAAPGRAAPVLSSSAADGAVLSLSGSFVRVAGLAFDTAGVAVAASGNNLAFSRLDIRGASHGIQCNDCSTWSVDTTEFATIATAAVLAENSVEARITGNWAHNLGADGFVVSGSATSIANNIVQGVVGEGIVVTETAAGAASEVTGNFVRGGGLIVSGAAVIANNIVWEASGHGISSDLSQGAGDSDVVVLHNTVVDASASCFHALDWPLSSGAPVVANNVFYCPSGSAVLYETGTSENLVMVGNVYLGTADFPGDSVLGGSVDADFEAPERGNFYPTGESPFMDAGDPAFTVGADFDGTPRGGTPDVGAYERVAAQNPNPTPGGGFKGSGPSDGGDGLDGDDAGTGPSDAGFGADDVGSGGFSGIGKGPAGTGDFPERDDGCQCSLAAGSALPLPLAGLILLMGALFRRRPRS